MRLFLLCTLLLFIGSSKHQWYKTVQFNITKILNARPVSTLKNNQITTWTTGIDGGGRGDGYLTLSAALFNGDKQPHALPDNPEFKDNNFKTKVKLHYTNNDTSLNQTCNITGEGMVNFKVYDLKYWSVYLALTSSEGPSQIQVTLIYTTGNVTRNFVIPDYYADLPPGDKNICYLAHDLAKWDNKNHMAEKDHHNIDLLKIETDPHRILTDVKITKNKPGYLVLWAAAGDILTD